MLNIISSDRLWLESLSVSLGFLLDYDVKPYTHISTDFESMVEQAEEGSVLLVDSNIPGVDYWALLEWLRDKYAGRVIILKDTWSYNLCSEKMIRNGCYAVLDKKSGFVAFWQAISAALKGQQGYVEDASLFSRLNESERELADDLLYKDIGAISRSAGISQQAANKRKLSLFRKLNIPTASRDKPFKLLAKLSK
jgi:DNA-binding NarL/FixJ family response regulator